MLGLGLVLADMAFACEPATLRLAIDVGHSPGAPGAISARGRPEHAFNVDVAEAIRERLVALGMEQVQVLRLPGDRPALRERAAAAAAMDAELFLSVHHDSVQPMFLERWWPPDADGPMDMSRHAAGYSLFVSQQNVDPAASTRFARQVALALQERGFERTLHHAEPIPGESRQLLDPALGIYRFDELYVLRRTVMPAVLFEVGVIKHPEEEEMLLQPATHAKVADAVAVAVQNYCQEVE